MFRTRFHASAVKRCSRYFCAASIPGSWVSAEDAPTYEFNMPARDLDDALRALGATSDIQILFSPEIVRALRSRAAARAAVGHAGARRAARQHESHVHAHRGERVSRDAGGARRHAADGQSDQRGLDRGDRRGSGARQTGRARGNHRHRGQARRKPSEHRRLGARRDGVCARTRRTSAISTTS